MTTKTATTALSFLILLLIPPLSLSAPICVEAESATSLTPPMRIASATNSPPAEATVLAQASGQAALDVPQGVGKPPEVGGDATLTFTLPSDGEYILWGRAWWDDECGNSLTLSIDDGRDFSFGQDPTYKTWHWIRSTPRLKQLKLTAGKHTLKIKNREDGIKLDQVLFTKSKRYVPIGTVQPTPSR